MLSTPRSYCLLGLMVLMLAAFVRPLTAHAQNSAKDLSRSEQADALFARGREAMTARDYAQACALLQDSYLLDPATGSLLALAICHEWEGKLASAFREYEDVAARGEDEGRPDRARAASERVAALRPALSTLTLHLAADTRSSAGREVRIDQALVDPSMYELPIPVDGGTHEVVVSAPQKQTFRVSVNMAAHHDNQTVSIPALSSGAVMPEPTIRRPRAVPIVQPVAGAQAERSQNGTESRPYLRAVGITTLSAGLVALVAGTLLTLKDVHDNNVQNSGCSKAGCVDDPPQTPLTLGGTSSAALIAGASLTVAGTVMLIIARRAERSDEAPAVTLAPVVAGRAAGAVLRGHF